MVDHCDMFINANFLSRQIRECCVFYLVAANTKNRNKLVQILSFFLALPSFPPLYLFLACCFLFLSSLIPFCFCFSFSRAYEMRTNCLWYFLYFCYVIVATCCILVDCRFSVYDINSQLQYVGVKMQSGYSSSVCLINRDPKWFWCGYMIGWSVVVFGVNSSLVLFFLSFLFNILPLKLKFLRSIVIACVAPTIMPLSLGANFQLGKRNICMQCGTIAQCALHARDTDSARIYALGSCFVFLLFYLFQRIINRI